MRKNYYLRVNEIHSQKELLQLRRRGCQDYCNGRCGKRHGGEKTETSRATMRSITDRTENVRTDEPDHERY
jgi:hypothetical protein